MLQSFFTGLSGMFSFSKSLDNVSNNVANMNTPGFRGTNTFLKSVTGSGEQGYGTTVDSTSTRLSPGEVRQTGNETDLAITGHGLFILRNGEGERFYTRAGQFVFDENNVLVDSITGYEVMAITESDNLARIDITDNRLLPAVPTSNIAFTGNLLSTSEEHALTPVTIISSSGESVDLTLQFTNPPATDDVWTVDILDENDTILATNQIQFDAAGTPLAGFNQFDAALNIDGEVQTINFNFGDPGSLSGTTQLSGASNLGANSIDGNAVLGLMNISFTEDGTVTFHYTNGDEQAGSQIALASFANEQNLERISGSIFKSRNDSLATIGRANSESLGKIQGGSIELANVELTQEFADMLIIQRGYQASSQVMSVANELIEELYNNTRR